MSVQVDVILLKDVERLGAQGALVRVRSGFARNYLVPMGLAAPATAATLHAAEARRVDRKRRLERALAEAQALKRRLDGHSLTLKLALGVDDKPFGSVTAHDVSEALRREGFEIERRAVRLEQPIKALGVYEIPVHVQTDVTATVKVWVVKE